MNRAAAVFAFVAGAMEPRDLDGLREAVRSGRVVRPARPVTRSRKVAVKGTGGQGGTGRRRVKRKGGR